MSGQIDQQMERQLNEQPRRRETRVVYRSEERKIQILSLRQLLIVSWLARHVSMTRSRESPPPEGFETEFGNPLRLPRTYVSLRATDPVHRRADNRHVTIHQRSAALLRELAQKGTVLGPAQKQIFIQKRSATNDMAPLGAEGSLIK